ncbi:RTA1 like protein-domain-containing protein [Bisporella sp. PMI_857]|nr:RTA1 like protein-domain-containing protein [Bisporella sp. PMI_857]
MPKLLPLESGYYVWKYVPNIPASIVGIVLWVIISGLLGWRMFKTRTWFCSALIIGCLMEFGGYCARASAANKTNKLMPYILQSTLILLPPALFAATIYMCLGRIIILVGGEHLSLVKPRWLTATFVGFDVLSFIVQSGGAGMMAKGSNMSKLGNWLIVAGLFIQLIAFSLFGLTAVLFHSRIRKSPTQRSYAVEQSWIEKLWMLYGVSVLIIVRSIFRIVEFIMGEDGYLLTHEWTLYVFDTVPMLAVAVLFYLRYPEHIVSKETDDIQLESQSSGERIEPNKTG